MSEPKLLLLMCGVRPGCAGDISSIALSLAKKSRLCRVKEHCIQRGLPWDDSLANTSCQEQEYYEDLLRFYRYNYRVSACPSLLGAENQVLPKASFTAFPLKPTGMVLDAYSFSSEAMRCLLGCAA